MSYGEVREVPCPHGCGEALSFIDYASDPPPIPPPRGGYAALSRHVDDEGRRVWECPRCEGEL